MSCYDCLRSPGHDVDCPTGGLYAKREEREREELRKAVATAYEQAVGRATRESIAKTASEPIEWRHRLIPCDPPCDLQFTKPFVQIADSVGKLKYTDELVKWNIVDSAYGFLTLVDAAGIDAPKIKSMAKSVHDYWQLSPSNVDWNVGIPYDKQSPPPSLEAYDPYDTQSDEKPHEPEPRVCECEYCQVVLRNAQAAR